MKQLVAEGDLDANGFLLVEGKNFHHLRDVLRVSCGDMIFVRLKSGLLQPMTVCKIDGQVKKIILQVAGDSSDAEHTSKKSILQIFLFQFIANPSKMDLIIRQATECGVEKIFPVESEFCQKGNVESARKKASESGRWHKIIVEARQQSGSPVETQVFAPIPFAKVFDIWKSERGLHGSSLAIVLYERTSGTKNIHDTLKSADSFTGKINSKKGLSRIALVIGAEGGISSSEIKLLKQNGFIPVHFETNVLRCETAALYGIAALQTALMEDWNLKDGE